MRQISLIHRVIVAPLTTVPPVAAQRRSVTIDSPSDAAHLLELLTTVARRARLAVRFWEI